MIKEKTNDKVQYYYISIFDNIEMIFLICNKDSVFFTIIYVIKFVYIL